MTGEPSTSSSAGDLPCEDASPTIAVTMDPSLYGDVLSAEQSDGVSVSAWLTEAARRTVAIRRGLEAVAEWESLAGPLSEAEMDAARERRRERLARLREA